MTDQIKIDHEQASTFVNQADGGFDPVSGDAAEIKLTGGVLGSPPGDTCYLLTPFGPMVLLISKSRDTVILGPEFANAIREIMREEIRLEGRTGVPAPLVQNLGVQGIHRYESREGR